MGEKKEWTRVVGNFTIFVATTQEAFYDNTKDGIQVKKE
ncbi:hypothetical protein BBR47_11770 [Brevibacillus brevis NBRC 100599]|uniref:Uncharacterized protein n=1 Tax=Brevibacillus brevis (strain 47 / JCM 6285 / NBRC 100599) TaxID=358681 RepID=C0Z7B1_BREBN|nr:hypothetical protein BBR47_11770 [Brevibacillus brevis NBRC 100599]